MKKIIITIAMLIPFLSKGQAHLVSTESEIRSLHPDNIFTKGRTNNGKRYIMSKMRYGTFIYYFDDFGFTDFNIQIPTTLTDANAQVEIYNSKYVINSTNSWTAYLEGGGIMKIDLIFDKELDTYVFTYINL